MVGPTNPNKLERNTQPPTSVQGATRDDGIVDGQEYLYDGDKDDPVFDAILGLLLGPEDFCQDADPAVEFTEDERKRIQERAAETLARIKAKYGLNDQPGSIEQAYREGCISPGTGEIIP